MAHPAIAVLTLGYQRIWAGQGQVGWGSLRTGRKLSKRWPRGPRGFPGGKRREAELSSPTPQKNWCPQQDLLWSPWSWLSQGDPPPRSCTVPQPWSPETPGFHQRASCETHNHSRPAVAQRSTCAQGTKKTRVSEGQESPPGRRSHPTQDPGQQRSWKGRSPAPTGTKEQGACCCCPLRDPRSPQSGPRAAWAASSKTPAKTVQIKAHPYHETFCQQSPQQKSVP